MTQDSISSANNGVNAIHTAWRFFDIGARDVLARLRTISCNECARPIRWWNRRVWMAGHERCAHRQCWNGQLFLKAYFQLMSEELRQPANPRATISDRNSPKTELSELCASARALRERVERLDAQLQQAKILAAKTRINAARKNGRLPTPSSKISTEG